MRTATATPGSGRLAVELVGGRSAVVERFAASPLRLLGPRNHGVAAWAYTSTFGGGLVDGDALDLQVRVGAGASALVSTQASTKVYRSPRGTAQALRAEVGDHGLLVVLADPVVPFAGARYDQLVDVALSGRGSLVVVDALAAGRVANGERWAFDRVGVRLRVRRDGVLLLDDGLLLDPGHGHVGARMERFDAWGTVLAVGPRVAPVAAGLLAARRASHDVGSGALEAVAAVGDGCLLRLAATSTAALARRLREVLAWLPELLGDDPLARRW